MSTARAESLISASVGFSGVNRSEDVAAVVCLFAMIGVGGKVAAGAPNIHALAVEIRTFQKHLHFPTPDGRIDVGGKSLRALMERAAEKLRAGMAPPTASPPLKAKIIRALSAISFHPKPAHKTKPHAPQSAGGASKLTDQDFTAAAERLKPGVQAAMIHAFAEVESGGRSGFGSAGLPVIAYEGHIFRKLTNHIYDATHKLLSYKYVKKAGPEWQINNSDQATAWKTLEEAMALDHDAALQACSWGMFQVMGFNYSTCGYTSVDDFVTAMKAGERGQLDAFVGFCLKTHGLRKALAGKDFVQCATLYNGQDYGDYDKRIERAFKKHGGT